MMRMLKKNVSPQLKLHAYTIEDLMPQDHFLRDVDRLVDFDFVYDKVEHLYSNTGKPSIDPVIIIKMLLIGYLYGIMSERQLEKEIIVNIAYRWFLGLDLDDDVPDHSTLSQLRRRKFNDSTLFQEIFDEIVYRCIDAELVDGKLLLRDSTHIRANVRDDLREKITVAVEPSEYMKKLDELALQDGLIKTTKTMSAEKTKKITKSTTDPDCGILKRTGKPSGFHYLCYETVDSKNGIITDVEVTAGNHSDANGCSESVQNQIEKFNFETEEFCADTAFNSGEIHNDMLDMNIKTFIPMYKSRNQFSDLIFSQSEFKYIEEENCYICPNNCKLIYSSFDKGRGYLIYAASTKDCRNCPIKSKCVSSEKVKCRKLSRHYHQTAIDTQRENNKTARYKEVMKLRQIWCEGNYSHQKARHCLSRAKMRGIEKVTEQCLMSACALNLIRLVKGLKRQRNTSVCSLIFDVFANFHLYFVFA
jgi:transposase